MSVQFSIVLPAYNESARIGNTLQKIIAHCKLHTIDAEILVVNDGSTDNTADVVRSFASQYSRLKLVENTSNRGKGYSVRNGMLHSAGEVILFSDADLSSPIEEAELLFAEISSGAQVAIGSRWVRTELQTQRQPVLRQLYGRTFNLLLRVILGLQFKDTQCGFKAFTRNAAFTIFPLQRIERWGFDPEILFLAQKLGFRVKEVPVKWAHQEGTRLNPIRDGIRMFGEILRVRWYASTRKYDDAQPALAPTT